jgi:hypothetical protein
MGAGKRISYQNFEESEKEQPLLEELVDISSEALSFWVPKFKSRKRMVMIILLTLCTICVVVFREIFV